MKKILIFFLFILIIGVNFSSDGGEVKKENGVWNFVTVDKKSKNLYREIPFGSNKEYVKKHLNEDFNYEDESTLGYESKILNIPSEAYFKFNKDKFWRVEFNSKAIHYTAKYWFKDYKTVKNVITQKYGAPSKDMEMYENVFYRNNPDYSLENGFLTLYTIWNLENIRIVITMGTYNEKIHMNIYYDSKEFLDKNLKNMYVYDFIDIN
ncbi:hypothetical protein OSSY52_17800 [Tepiditoga spiralis]|uniref:Uncharacterized protein n=1 Tax=Tepiditoga spiralis TaxID=2108365 RepID=A0A7G1GC24_9BACT|nr:hypothetical protein [Tepiditoga spiralis]BBE31639.1 hypothetical protein OSSY52_17800 [Tepiditoga spiralis]